MDKSETLQVAQQDLKTHTQASEAALRPWLKEPNEKRWTNEETGLACVLLRGPTGAWCGYVGVDEEHPAHGFTYYKSDFDLDEILDGSALPKVKIQKQINEIQVHGGLTYAGADEQRGKDLHWFGFDCSHAGDYSPKYDELYNQPPSPLALGAPTGWGTVIEYRDLAYAETETNRLAKQLGAIK